MGPFSPKRAGLALAVSLVAGALTGLDARAQFLNGEASGAEPFDWSGPYIGLFLGAGGGDTDWVWNNGTRESFDVNGPVGGFLAGFNFHFDQFVVGFEGDVGVADWSGSRAACWGGPWTCSLDVDWIATARLRGGYAMDDFLLYLTGGLAFADITGTSVTAAGTVYRDSNHHTGWIGGAGIAGALTHYVIGQAELLYFDLGEETYRYTGTGPPPVSASAATDLSGIVARIGVTAKFMSR